MPTHSAVAAIMEDQMRQLKEIPEKRKLSEPFEDPVREFHRASHVEGTVRQWLTYTIEARQKNIENAFTFIPQQEGEKDSDFQSRERERWRALCVIIQEESRAALGIDADPANSSPEIAITALKKLFPGHWKKGA